MSDNWNISTSLSNEHLEYHISQNHIPDDVQVGDQVVLYEYNGSPLYTSNIIGKDPNTILRNIARGMNNIVKPSQDNIQTIYNIVTNFSHPRTRTSLIEKYETRQMRVYELHMATRFEGLRKEGSFLYLNLGS